MSSEPESPAIVSEYLAAPAEATASEPIAEPVKPQNNASNEDAITVFNFENQLTRVTSHFGLLTDCIYNSARSRSVLVLTYALVAVIALQILVLLLDVPPAAVTTLEWNIEPSRVSIVAVPFSNFSVTLRKGATDPIVGARLRATLIPYRSFPLTINIQPENTTHVVRWVDCLAVIGGAMTPVNQQNYPICDIQNYVEGTDAVTDSDGNAQWNNLVLRHGPITDYLLKISVIEFGHLKKNGDLTEDDLNVAGLQTSVQIVPLAASIDVSSVAFDASSYEMSVSASLHWTEAESLLQTALSAVSTVAQIANKTSFVNFAKLGIKEVAPPALQLNPVCLLFAIDISDVQNTHIVNVASMSLMTANFTNRRCNFTPSGDATQHQGSANVTMQTKLNSLTYGFYLVASCLGVMQPISPFSAVGMEAPFNAMTDLLFPFIPATLLGPNLTDRVQSLTGTMKSGLLVQQPGSPDAYFFNETDEVVMDLSLVWTSPTGGMANPSTEETVYCEIIEAPPLTGTSGFAADAFVLAGPKALVNGSVDVPLTQVGSERRGNATLHAKITTAGHTGVYILTCNVEGVILPNFIFLAIGSAVSATKSTFSVAPQPWQTDSAGSSQQQTIYEESLGVQWLSTPTLRIVSHSSEPLAGKHVTVRSTTFQVAVKFEASASGPNGDISFSRIMFTSMGFGYNASSPIPRVVTFAFMVDDTVIGYHNVRLQTNAKVEPSAFCNVRFCGIL